MRIRLIGLVVGLCLGVMDSASGQALVLSINGTSVAQGSSADVLMGVDDPNQLIVSGPPGEEYALWLGWTVKPLLAPGPRNLDPSSFPAPTYTGTLDLFGNTVINFPPGVFIGTSGFDVQALVGPPALWKPGRATGILHTTFVETMSSPILWTLPAGVGARILGPITAVGTSSVSVGNLDFDVTPTTVLGNFASLTELEVGQWLDVDGEYNASGGLTAIELNREDPQANVRIRGRVQGLGPAGFVILDRSVFVGPETVYTDFVTGAPSTFGAVAEQMTVQVWIPAETLFPQVVEMSVGIPPEPEPEPEPELDPEDLPPPSFCS